MRYKLKAFCLVFYQFSKNMERYAKSNLLLCIQAASITILSATTIYHTYCLYPIFQNELIQRYKSNIYLEISRPFRPHFFTPWLIQAFHYISYQLKKMSNAMAYNVFWYVYKLHRSPFGQPLVSIILNVLIFYFKTNKIKRINLMRRPLRS